MDAITALAKQCKITDGKAVGKAQEYSRLYRRRHAGSVSPVREESRRLARAQLELAAVA